MAAVEAPTAAAEAPVAESPTEEAAEAPKQEAAEAPSEAAEAPTEAAAGAWPSSFSKGNYTLRLNCQLHMFRIEPTAVYSNDILLVARHVQLAYDNLVVARHVQ